METGKICVEERAFQEHQCHLLMKVKSPIVTPILRLIGLSQEKNIRIKTNHGRESFSNFTAPLSTDAVNVPFTFTYNLQFTLWQQSTAVSDLYMALTLCL